MSSPTIPDLNSATVANDTDLLLMRQPGNSGGTDKKVTVALVRNINLAGLAPLPSNATASDLMLIARGGVNYQIRHDQISVPSGTQMWFYANGTIAGWSLVATGDNLLAVKGGAGDYATGGVENGTWQQASHTLTTAEIPSHTHDTRSISRIRPGSPDSPTNQFYAITNNTSGTFIRGGVASGIQNQGGGGAHDHGNTWRPKANVGVILRKN